MEPAARHERDPLGNAHPRDRAPVREVHAQPELRRALERHGALPQGPVARPALPRQHRPVRDERDQAEPGQEPPQMPRVLDGLDLSTGRALVDACRRERPARHLGQLLQQHGTGRAGVDGPTASGEADGQAGLDVVRLDYHRGAGEHDLGGALNLQAAAPARAPISPHHLADRRFHAPRQEVLEGDPAHRVFEQGGIEAVLPGPDPCEGRRGERIALHPVHEEGERTEIVGAGEVFVSPVPLAVYAVERCPQALHPASRGPSSPRRRAGWSGRRRAPSRPRRPGGRPTPSGCREAPAPARGWGRASRLPPRRGPS